MSINFRPLGSYVIIEKPAGQGEKVTDGGIIVAESAQEEQNHVSGKVVATGDGYLTPEGNTTPLRVKVGDVVVYPSFIDSRINIDGEDYMIVKEQDIIGVKGD